MDFKRIIVGAFGGAFAGVGVFVIWPSILFHLGWWGGFFAAGTIIPIAWFVNHYCGVFPNQEGGSWVDMAFPIGLTAFFGGILQVTPGKDTPFVRAAHGLLTGGDFSASLSTFVVVAIGASIGGLLAAWFVQATTKKEA